MDAAVEVAALPPSVDSPPSASSSGSGVEESVVPYQETARFCTWRKHVRDLYQHLVHIDLVWESPSVCLMPYMTVKGDLATHTLLCGTRTGGQEQSYLQLLAVTAPRAPTALERTYETYCDATGEVGGYGMAPSTCGMRVERRMLHDGDPLEVRYMHANPLLLASASSDGDAYVFDWSRVSLNRYPNDPPRPRAPLPPNEPSDGAGEEERLGYQRRMRALRAVVAEQDGWDRRRGGGQHVLTLPGGGGALDWSTAADGVLATGAAALQCWQVGATTKGDGRALQPTATYALSDWGNVSALRFSWTEPTVLVAATAGGNVLGGDTRAASVSPLFAFRWGLRCAALSPRDGTQLLLGTDDGRVVQCDTRQTAAPVAEWPLHAGAVTAVQWCPHSRHLFASGGEDGTCGVVNATAQRLLFRHAAHTETVTDVGWNWQEGFEGQLVSVDTNAITLWRPRDIFFTA